MDCFYAAVEIRDNPSLKEKPVVVGGKPNTRGVVSTCSYEARKYGIHSAMSCARAYQLCPQAIFVPTQMAKYRKVSNQIREIFKKYTEIIEPLSLDEAYLDVTGHELYATEIAKRIRKKIESETGLTGSAGVAANKLIAKIASDVNKPNGLTVVIPEKSKAFMRNLPLRKIPGIGAVTEKRLKEKGLNICSDIWVFEPSEMIMKFGRRMGEWLYNRSRGIDDRPVKPNRERKSLSYETTFSEDILDNALLDLELDKISKKVSSSLKKKNLSGRTITLKVKYFNFKQVTRSITNTDWTDDSGRIMSVVNILKIKTDIGSINPVFYILITSLPRSFLLFQNPIP